MSPLFRRRAREGEPPLPSDAPQAPYSLALSYSDDFPGSEPEPRPGLLGLLVLLFFKPRRFFRHFNELPAGPALYLLAFSCGLAWAVSNDGLRSSLGLSSREADTWAMFWGPSILGGLFWGLIFLSAGHWWFLRGLRWCGHQNPDKSDVRKVFLWAGQVTALPAIIHAVARTFMYPRPSASSATQEGTISLVILGLAFWSLGVDYIGVRSVFLVRKGRVVVWFIVVPLVLMVFIGTISVLASGGFFPPPDLDKPNAFSSRTMSFSYPGNWTIMKGDMPFEPDSTVWIKSVRGSVQGIMIHTPELGADAALQFATDRLSDIYARSSDLTPFDTWGSFQGKGRAFQGKFKGKVPLTVRIFVAALPNSAVLEVREVLIIRGQGSDGPGHELVRNSLKLAAK